MSANVVETKKMVELCENTNGEKKIYYKAQKIFQTNCKCEQNAKWVEKQIFKYNLQSWLKHL